jgi:hypothetical protein
VAWWMIGLAAAASMQAAPTPTPPKPGDVVVNGRATKKVCERMMTLGSIIPTRVCRTPDEWEQIREQARLTVQDMQDAQMQRQNAERHRAGQ